MMAAGKLEPALKLSVFALAAERRRLESEIELLENRMASAHGAESASLTEQLTRHRAAIVEIEQRQAAEREARRVAEEKAQRELLRGRARDLVEHEEARLAAIAEAEAAMLAFVAAVGRAFAQSEAVRGVAREIADACGIRLLSFTALSGSEMERRLAYGISAHLAKLQIPGRLAGGRVGSLQLVGATLHATTPGSWAASERAQAAADVAELLEREGAGQ
jgi:hypothetical protein